MHRTKRCQLFLASSFQEAYSSGHHAGVSPARRPYHTLWKTSSSLSRHRCGRYEVLHLSGSSEYGECSRRASASAFIDVSAVPVAPVVPAVLDIVGAWLRLRQSWWWSPFVLRCLSDCEDMRNCQRTPALLQASARARERADVPLAPVPGVPGASSRRWAACLLRVIFCLSFCV